MELGHDRGLADLGCMDILVSERPSLSSSERDVPPLPAAGDLDGAPVEDEVDPATPISADSFINRFKKPLQEPVLQTTPTLRTTKAIHDLVDDEWIPKHSVRLAAKSKFREAKPEVQARKVMMKRLGLQIETKDPDEASFDEFHTAFRRLVSLVTREAMQVLFLGRK